MVAGIRINLYCAVVFKKVFFLSFIVFKSGFYQTISVHEVAEVLSNLCVLDIGSENL